MPFPYSGNLNNNRNINQSTITGAIKNMIISQDIRVAEVADTELADYFRIDGTMFGDTKLYYFGDIGAPFAWSDSTVGSADRLSANLLDVHRNKSIVCQSISMGIYKYVPITTDQYLSKQAFMSEGTFAEMLGVFTSMLSQTKKVYDRSLINCFIGTNKSTLTACNRVIPKANNSDSLRKTQEDSLNVMKEITILKATIKDNSRQFNELKYLRSYNYEDFIVVWNINQKASIMDISRPITFNENGLGETGLKEFDLTGKWFGTINTAPTIGSATVLCAKSGWYNVNAITAAYLPDYAKASDTVKAQSLYLNEGDEMPPVGLYTDAARGIQVSVVSTTFPANLSYTVDPNVIMKLVHKESLPFMSGFEESSEFWNPLAKINNQYLNYGHNELEFLKDKPFVTISFAP